MYTVREREAAVSGPYRKGDSVKPFLILTTLMFTGFFVLGAQAAVITFEDLSGAGPLPSNYAGLTWDSGWGYWGWEQTPYTPHSGVQRLYYYGSLANFLFPSSVVFNGAWFAGTNTMQYQLYLGGSPVATSAEITLTSTPQFLNSGYVGNVDEVRVAVVGGGGGFGMDDVTYNEAGGAIPEPATFGLMGFGLTGLALLRRRARATR